MSDPFLKFEDWEKTIADYVKKDSLWDSFYYRVALYLYDLVWDGRWYFRSRKTLPCDLLEHRYKVIDHLRALAVNTLNSHKGNLGQKK